MTTSEIPRQYDRFTGELKNIRTRAQKKAQTERGYQQPLMFPVREIAQCGVENHSLLPLAKPLALGLVREDPRRSEEIARDVLHEAQRQTSPLFESEESSNPANMGFIPLALTFNLRRAALFSS